MIDHQSSDIFQWHDDNNIDDVLLRWFSLPSSQPTASGRRRRSRCKRARPSGSPPSLTSAPTLLCLNGNHHHYHHDHDYHQIPEEVQEGEALPRRQVEVQAHQRCPVHAGLQWYLDICICICNIFVFVHIWIFNVWQVEVQAHQRRPVHVILSSSLKE